MVEIMTFESSVPVRTSARPKPGYNQKGVFRAQFSVEIEI
jgi:hypothetical protein